MGLQVVQVMLKHPTPSPLQQHEITQRKQVVLFTLGAYFDLLERKRIFSIGKKPSQ
jgi:hypothetical protein